MTCKIYICTMRSTTRKREQILSIRMKRDDNDNMSE